MLRSRPNASVTRAAAFVWPCVALALLLPGPATAQTSNRAISQINGKFDLQGGAVNDGQTGLGEGSVSFPLGDSFGLQLDGAFGRRDPHLTGGGAFHVFWRNPNDGLAGIVGERALVGGKVFNRAGFEGELYEPRWTLATIVGYENGPFVPGVRRR